MYTSSYKKGACVWLKIVKKYFREEEEVSRFVILTYPLVFRGKEYNGTCLDQKFEGYGVELAEK